MLFRSFAHINFLKNIRQEIQHWKKKHKQKKQDSFIGHELTFHLWR